MDSCLVPGKGELHSSELPLPKGAAGEVVRGPGKANIPAPRSGRAMDRHSSRDGAPIAGCREEKGWMAGAGSGDLGDPKSVPPAVPSTCGLLCTLPPLSYPWGRPSRLGSKIRGSTGRAQGGGGAQWGREGGGLLSRERQRCSPFPGHRGGISILRGRLAPSRLSPEGPGPRPTWELVRST